LAEGRVAGFGESFHVVWVFNGKDKTILKKIQKKWRKP
jgi:hypothetical protein